MFARVELDCLAHSQLGAWRAVDRYARLEPRLAVDADADRDRGDLRLDLIEPADAIPLQQRRAILRRALAHLRAALQQVALEPQLLRAGVVAHARLQHGARALPALLRF